MVEGGGLPFPSFFTLPGEKIVARHGEQPGHGDQVEVGIPFLADIPLALSMETVDTDGLFGDLVQFLDGPALVVKVADVGGGPGGGSKKGGCQDDIRFPGDQAYKPEGNGIKPLPGPSFLQSLLAVAAEGCGNYGFDLVPVHELRKALAGVGLQPEQGMDPVPVEVIQEFKRKIASVHDHDVTLLEFGKVPFGRGPFTTMGGKREGYGNPITGPVEAGDQP